MPRRSPGPPCSVCSQPSVAKGLCDKHYRRQAHFGNVDGTLRPADWGKRSKHPLNNSWCWLKKFDGRVERWDDFWTFVADVGERPPKAQLRRHRKDEPWGPENFYWSRPVEIPEGNSQSDINLYMRAWRKQNPMRAKSGDMRRKYGIGLEEYDAILASQGGGCAICGKQKQSLMLPVDHCHESRKVRGILCTDCNRGLGSFNDNTERLRAAIQYLESHK